MPTRVRRKRSLTTLGNLLLMALAHHRMATTTQLQRMLRSQTTHPHHLRKMLRRLRADGLADRIFRPDGGDSVWFATPTGTTLAQMSGGVPRRPYRMNASRAAGPLQKHALAVNEVGLAFLEHSRREDVSQGPFSWTPEVAHRYHYGGRDQTLITDAVLDYSQRGGGLRYDLPYAIEVDRATMPVHRLAQKIRSYRDYASYAPVSRSRRPSRQNPTPAWLTKYRWFPTVLVVLTGAAAQTLRSRSHALQKALGTWASKPDATVMVGVVRLERLQRDGPGAEIFLPLHYSADHLTNVLLGLDED